MAALEASGSSWSGVKWNGNSWSGSSWSGNSWSGSSWSGVKWSGKSGPAAAGRATRGPAAVGAATLGRAIAGRRRAGTSRHQHRVRRVTPSSYTPVMTREPTPGRARPLRIGITGPIGCGKSTVAGWLGERPGVVVIDADVVAREVLEPGEPALDQVVARFGSDLLRDRWVAGPCGARSPGLRGSDCARGPGGDRPSRRPAADPGGDGRRGAKMVRRRSWSRRSGWSKAASPRCATRSGWSPATRRRNGRALDRPRVDAGGCRRRGSRPGRAGRSGRASATRVIDTSGSEAVTGASVEAALESVLDAPRDPPPADVLGAADAVRCDASNNGRRLPCV